MGSTLSKIRGSLVTRPMQRYNIESRTEKLLEKDQVKDSIFVHIEALYRYTLYRQVVPRAAPKFKSDRELLEEIRRTQPEIAEAATKKDQQLHKNLQDVSVGMQRFSDSCHILLCNKFMIIAFLNFRFS